MRSERGPSPRAWLSTIVVASTLSACAPPAKVPPEPPVDAGEPVDVAPETDDAALDNGASDAGADAGPVEARFQSVPCQGTFASAGFECAYAATPFDWQQPHGQQISVHVARLKASKSSRGQFWLLAGGPGQPASDLITLATGLAKVVPEFDIYLPDHRGVGYSSRLSCPDQEAANSLEGEWIGDAEFDDCRQHLQAGWGGNLAHFNVSAAARDVGLLVASRRDQGDEVFVLGVSYGTYQALRYLSLASTPPTGLILGSAVVPGQWYLDLSSAKAQPVVGPFLGGCVKHNEQCAKHLGATPLKRLQTLYTKIEQGHCSAVTAEHYPTDKLRLLLGNLASRTGWGEMAAAVIHRLDRCANGDIAALKHLHKAMSQTSALPSGKSLEERRSRALSMYIFLSELWSSSSHTPAQVAQEAKTHLMALSTSFVSPVFDTWPRYPMPAAAHTPPPLNVPTLVVSGQVDLRTPSYMAETLLSSARQAPTHHIAFEAIGHSALSQSAVPTWDPDKKKLVIDGPTCGMQAVAAFVDAPAKKPSLPCMDLVWPDLYYFPKDWIAKVLGTPSLWDNAGKTDRIGPTGQGASLPPEARRALAGLGRMLGLHRMGTPP